MSQSFLYYHNPRCSKSRQGLALLEEKGIDFQIKEYLKEGLTPNELKELFKKLPLEPIKAIRVKESVYKDLELAKKDLSLDELCQVVSENPILLERPIISGEKSAVVGRPPEDLLKII